MNHRNEFVFVKAFTDKCMISFVIVKWCGWESQPPTQGTEVDYFVEPMLTTATQ